MSHHHQHYFPRAVPIREAVTFAGFAIALIGGAAAVLGDYPLLGIGAAQAAKSGSVFNRATYSSPIAMSADNTLVWSVNPGDDSVSVIRTSDNTKITNIKVGDEPQSVALDPNNEYAYVANAAGSSVSVIKIKNANPNAFDAAVDRKSGKRGQLTTGAEPWDIVTSPDGKRVFVANSGQDTITVIDAKKQTIIGNIDIRNSLCNDPDRNRRFQPRALAITQDNTKLYVTRFFSFVKVGGKQGVDDGREGLVCRLDINTSAENISGYQVAAAITLAPRLTGFSPAGLAEPSTAFANQLQSIVIRGNQAYLPNIAASPTDPLVFNNETMAFVNIIDNVNGGSQSDASLAKFFQGGNNIGPNLHLGARDPEAGKKRLFFANPWGIAFTNQSGAGAAYVISAASDLLVKVNVAADGAISFTGGGATPSNLDTTRYIDLNDPANPATNGFNAGKNPVGIVINDAGTTAYVNNFVSHNVSVVNLTNDAVSKVIRTTDLPAPGSKAEIAIIGAEQFFASRGHYNQPPGTSISISERLSAEGWQACSSCHFKGLTDSVVWQFNTGPRKSISLNGTFDPHDTLKTTSNQRILNYSPIRDEVADFDPNIRDTSGPGGLLNAQLCSDPQPGAATTSNFDPNHGLILGDSNAQLGPCIINNLAVKANGPGKRNEITVTLPGSNVEVPALTALNEWVRVAIRTPNGPLNNVQVSGGVPLGDIISGRVFFKLAGCAGCHGGNQWTSSILDFDPPPNDAVEGFTLTERTGVFVGNPSGAQFLQRFLRDIKSFDLNVVGSGNAIPGQPLIGAPEKTARVLQANGTIQAAQQDALGKDYNSDGRGIGFSPPSLLGIGLLPPYYHNGACETLACVLANVNHRTAAGTFPFGDILADPNKRAKVVRFLESIDVKTSPINR
jgi:YVTN family beta-propeller protein